MDEKNYINYHILISHSPSNLNRDDMNMQKTAVFGGTKRTRISSQSLKRAIRHSDYYKNNIGQPSDRTRQLGQLTEKYVKALDDKYSKNVYLFSLDDIPGTDNEKLIQVVKPILNIGKTVALNIEKNSDNTTINISYKEKEKDNNILLQLNDEKTELNIKIDNHIVYTFIAKTEDKKINIYENLIREVMSRISGKTAIISNTQSGAVAAWAVSEVDQYCKLYQQLQEQNPDPKEFEKAWKNATDKKKLLEDKTKLSLFRETLQNGQDIALSGRMATSGIMTIVDASLAVAHAITTHTVDGDIDWFTAVDDLNQETGETGSAHLDTTEFSSGVFYRYASLNIRQLQENLGDVDRTQALDIAAHVLQLLATVVPSAKQNAFAAFNLADFAFVSFSDQPISLANAFESPVESGREGLLIPSINAFADYHKAIYKAYGLTNDPQACFSTKDCKMENVTNKGTDFSALKEWLKSDGK